ncbi:RelA/SpoT family protein [Leeia oryzae]|uniref:RelA/SpoT family protein n=1 Tax=Leeia oryzae TaxID=356662 RepID=UPI000362BA85|nr:bifunctional (p)ppGpp synthetase/guanosine-3',5'-bis(diphosphate) 3'-pyrophosphohydrolase [Leeia oryzae]
MEEPAVHPAESTLVEPKGAPAAGSTTALLEQEIAAFFAKLKYLPESDIKALEAAYRFSEVAHEGQYRKSGEPYVSHPLAVASILADWHLDPQVLTAALLHDVVEDTAVTKDELQELFGKSVAELVDGLSKLEQIEFQSHEEAQAENFRKMLLAMARDIRIILIKIADRLHNMRTLDVMRPEKQRRIARETMDIYAPIANRIGLNAVYQDLQDLSFRFLHPNRYQVLSKAVKAARGNRRQLIDKILAAIQQKLNNAKLAATVAGREKNLFSIYKKMQEKHLTFSEVLDIYGFRVVVEDEPTCYLTLGVLHSLYKPIPGKFKDYIAIPKANGYQSLHTTLFGPYGTPIEVQIRTREMHRTAEDGIASHWMYKSTDGTLNDAQQRTHKWLQRLLDIQSESGDAAEFLEHIKVDLFPDEVYVFTPKGRILALPQGATAIDFAYAVHTDIGTHCVAARINYELMPLRTRLRSGDRVEVVTDPAAFPNPSWLSFVSTGKARSHIRHYLKTMQFSESVALGESLLEQALDVLAPQREALPEVIWDKYLKDIGVKSKEEVLTDIGLGKKLSMVVARALLKLSGVVMAEQQQIPAIQLRGWESSALHYGKCCYPLPGDKIVGLVTKGQGLVVHVADCPAVTQSDVNPENLVEIDWDPPSGKTYEAGLDVIAVNDRGVLAQVASVISDHNANIVNVQLEEFEQRPNFTFIRFLLQVQSRAQLEDIMRNLNVMQVVETIRRRKL